MQIVVAMNVESEYKNPLHSISKSSSSLSGTITAKEIKFRGNILQFSISSSLDTSKLDPVK